MSSSSKQNSSIADKSIILTISSLLSKVISLAATMIVTRMLDETAYATYKQVFLAFNVVLPFLAFGLSHGLFYFLPFEKERIRGRVYDCYAVFLTSGLAFAAFILLGGNQLLARQFDNPEVAPLLRLIVPYIVVVILVQCNAVIFNIMNRVRLYMVYTLFSGLISNLVLIVAILVAPTARTAVLAMTFTKTAEGIILLALTSRILPKDSSRPSLKAIKEILKFSIPLGVAGMIGTFSTQLDSLFVASMCETKDFAVYTVGAHELILIGVITSSVSSAVTPEMRICAAQGKLQECAGLYHLAARRMASVLIPMMCFFWVWADEFLVFVYSDKYSAAVWIFRVYLLYFLLRISVTGQVFSSLGMNKFILTRSIITCLLNGVLNYIGIKAFGMIGAAIATVLSGALVFIFSTAPMLKKKLDIPYSMTYPIKTVVGSLIVGFGSAYIIELIFGTKLVPWLVGAIKIESFLARLFDAELASMAVLLLQLGIYCVLFVALFAPLALLLMREDYNWIILKCKSILGKVFVRKKAQPAE